MILLIYSPELVPLQRRFALGEDCSRFRKTPKQTTSRWKARPQVSELWEVVEYGQLRVCDVIKHFIHKPAMQVQSLELSEKHREQMVVTAIFEPESGVGRRVETTTHKISGENCLRRVPNV